MYYINGIYFKINIFHFSSKPNPATLNNNKGVINGNNNGNPDPAVSLGGKACESCNGTYLFAKFLFRLKILS